VKIRDAKPEELVQPARAKKLSPRQQATQDREAKFRKLLDNLAAGVSPDDLLVSYPSLSREAVQAAIAYAADLARERIVPMPA